MFLLLFFCKLLSCFFLFAEVTGDSTIVRPRPRPERGHEHRADEIMDFVDQATLHLDINENYRFVVPQSGDLFDKCVGDDQYFKADGSLGEKGVILKREITGAVGARSTPMRGLYFRNTFPRMGEICRNYNNFTDDQKLNFWIWYNASKARTESECGRNAYNPNDPAGVSIGEMQMPASYENRKWRGIRDQEGVDDDAGGCEANPPPVVPPSYTHSSPPSYLMAQTENNLTCAVEVLSGVLCGFYRNPTERCNGTTQAPFGHGFWRQLRVRDATSFNNSPIIRNIRSFPLCGNTNVSS